MTRSVVYAQYTNPANYPPLEHSSRILADAGMRVRFYGAHTAGVEPMDMPPHPRIRVWNLEVARQGWRQRVRYLVYAVWVLAELAWDRPAWVYASDVRSYPVGLAAKLLFRVRVLMHEHDPPTAVGGWADRVHGWVRRQLARRADVRVVPQTERAAQFVRTLQCGPVHVVWNCPERRDVVEPGRKRGGLSIWYHGSIVPAQLPPAAVRALALLPDGVRFRFAGYETAGSVGYVNELLALAGELGVRDRVEYLGSRPTRGELFAAAAGCHVGLALFAKRFREPMAGASNKPFDYLACGLPLLVPDTDEWRGFFADPGYARVCDPADPASIAEAIRWFAAHPEQARAMGEAGRQRVLADWNYETQFVEIRSRLTDSHEPDVTCD